MDEIKDDFKEHYAIKKMLARYIMDCWTTTITCTHMMSIAKMCMLRQMHGKTQKDKTKKENISEYLGISPIKHKIREKQLTWYDHVMKGSATMPMKVSIYAC